MRSFLLVGAAAAFLAAPVFGQEDESRPRGRAPGGREVLPSGAAPPDVATVMKNARRSMEETKARMDEFQARQLEMLKKTDPKAYSERRRAMETDRKIHAVLEETRRAKMTDYEAEQKLRPLMKEKLKPEFDGLDRRIVCLEKELDFLRKAKKDYDVLIHLRINELRGKKLPELPCR